jgi:hypothetical protein
VQGAEARALLARFEAIDRQVTRCAREAVPETQPLVVLALGEMRASLRDGEALARALDRLETLWSQMSPTRAKFESVALHVRALVNTDRATADALYDAAERRADYARRADEIGTLRTRLSAEGERLLAELEHAALEAAALASRAQSTPRVRIDATVVRTTLAELDALEAELSTGAPASQRAR